MTLRRFIEPELQALIDSHRDGDLPPPRSRKAIRVAAGLTQAEVAAILGVHPETVGRWERGDGPPRRGETSLLYLRALEVMKMDQG